MQTSVASPISIQPKKKGDEFLVWLPRYEKGKGLHWYCQEKKKGLYDRQFRRCLLDSRPGAEIVPESYSAAEGGLRETECVNPWWRASAGCQDELVPMLFLGYVFLRNNSFRNQLGQIDTLFVGGDTRYGLGKICREEFEEISQKNLFDKSVHLDLNAEDPQVKSKLVFGHTLGNGDATINGMQGNRELVVGWKHASLMKNGPLAWVPGSFAEKESIWSIDENGYWRFISTI